MSKTEDEPSLIEELMAQRTMILIVTLGVAGALAYLIYLQNKKNNEILQGFNGNLQGRTTPPIQINNYSSSPQLPPPPPQFNSLPTNLEGIGINKPKLLDVQPYSKSYGPAYPKAETELEASRIISLATRLSTTTISNTQPTRLFHAAGDKIWRVQVRTISPMGSFAVIAVDPNILMSADNVTETAIIPANSFNEVFLHPNQGLWARGSVTNVVVSILASVIS